MILGRLYKELEIAVGPQVRYLNTKYENILMIVVLLSMLKTQCDKVVEYATNKEAQLMLAIDNNADKGHRRQC